MKTLIATIFAALVLSTAIAKTTNAAPAGNGSYIVVNDISNISKIEVRGNVELYISDGTTDEVKVYNKYYGENALVQSTNGVLRIASYKAEKLVVWVTANDLRSISAFNNSEVRSFGELSKIELAVDLHNSATAYLNLEAFDAQITVNDLAKADISGYANEYFLSYNNAGNINEKNFKAAKATRISNVRAQVKKTELDEIAAL